MKNISLIIILFLPLFLQAQEYKFGKVSKAELEEKFYPLDSTANAAILYTERKTNFEYSNVNGFFIVEKYFTRLKIYNKEGFENATQKILAYYNTSNKEKVTDIKATTYNLIDGKIVKNKLSKKNIYREAENKLYNSVKFTLPNLKPGSVIEWAYTFKSPFIAMFNEVKLQ
ncbi:MAG TPA: DUF3857 domain-containing protein, partial [Bacteroidetes bacterium]|nr:DUF3857 domain-containing protein [Bacteroidota bacterium]